MCHDPKTWTSKISMVFEKEKVNPDPAVIKFVLESRIALGVGISSRIGSSKQVWSSWARRRLKPHGLREKNNETVRVNSRTSLRTAEKLHYIEKVESSRSRCQQRDDGRLQAAWNAPIILPSGWYKSLHKEKLGTFRYRTGGWGDPMCRGRKRRNVSEHSHAARAKIYPLPRLVVSIVSSLGKRDVYVRIMKKEYMTIYSSTNVKSLA
ncbi:hypothetical protein DFH06DRAFT_1121020 [Mycena polygramma]|nr:hypothetical protein DFH06DRAFT_1121020 [Mycena polygramma]